MVLPRQNREQLEILAGRWLEVVAASRRSERFNRVATYAVLVCGGALLIFPEAIGPSAALTTSLTGGFMWGGWYKMYKVGSNRRRMRQEVAEIDDKLVALCGERASFEGATARITTASRDYDPFSDDSYG